MSHVGSDYSQESSRASEQKVYSPEELHHINGIKDILNAEYSSPSIELVRYLAARLSPGGQSESMVDRLGPIVRCALDQCIDDFVSDRLRSMEFGSANRETNDTGCKSDGLGVTMTQEALMSAEEFERCFIVDVC